MIISRKKSPLLERDGAQHKNGEDQRWSGKGEEARTGGTVLAEASEGGRYIPLKL